MIIVYHRLRTESDIARYESVATVATESLDEAYELTNHIDLPWQQNLGLRARSANERSTSVGDLMEIDRVLWRVAPAGFERMSRGVLMLDGTMRFVTQAGTYF